MPITKTYVINETDNGDAMTWYELLDEQGNHLWSGLGDAKVEGLLQIMMRIEGGEPRDGYHDS